MHSIYETQLLMEQGIAERLRRSRHRREVNSALRRSRVRSTLRRAIEDGLRCGIEPHEVEREFTTTLQQVTSR